MPHTFIKENTMSKVKTGNNVSVHYVGTLDDGTEFDSSRSRGAPLSFQVGSGQLIAGFDAALSGMVVGETKTITLVPADAYGEASPEHVQTAPRNMFPSDFEFKVGATVYGKNENGQEILAKINSFDNEEIILDFNHPMAGKTLNFDIELISIDSTNETPEK